MLIQIGAHGRIKLRVRAGNSMTCMGKRNSDGGHCRTTNTKKVEGAHRWPIIFRLLCMNYLAYIHKKMK